jgi:serine/threonine-protein kinase
MDLSAGAIVGSYQIDREISRGSHAVIYRAWQRSVGRWVALKVLSKRGSQALASFRREIRLTGNVSHPGVRQVYDAGETPDGYPYLAMQFVDTSLREMLRRCQGQARKFSREEVLRYLTPMADVLDHIHKQGIVHLDVKPENILMFGDGRVVLADFGSALRVGSMTHQGTPRYLSPEQAAGNRPVGPWSDLYSLACVGYEMLAGQPPFGGDLDVVLVRQHLTEAPTPLRELRPDLSRRVQRPFDDALSKDPRERPASAGAFIELLRRGGRGTALASGSEGLVIAGGVALIALVVIVILIAVYWLRLAASPAQLPNAAGLSSSMPSALPTSLPALACASVMPAILCPASTHLSGADQECLLAPNADGFPAPEPRYRSYHWSAAALLA